MLTLCCLAATRYLEAGIVGLTLPFPGLQSGEIQIFNRCLLAIGQLITSAEGSEVLALAEDLGCEAAAQKLVLNHSQKVSATAREVSQLLRK